MDARRRVAAAAHAHGKFAGIPASPQNVGEMYDLGYRFLTVGSDVVSLSQYCAAQLKGVGEALAGRRG